MLSSFGYAAWNDRLTTTMTLTSASEDIEITAWQIISTNSYDVNGNGVILGDELKIENVNDGNSQVVGLTITADPIFPEWELKLLVEIKNLEDPVYLSYEIEYFDGTTWQPTDEDGLLTLFRIIYTDGFYLNPGPDGTWSTEDDEPVPSDPEWQLWPGYNCYKLEHLIFDAQDYPELQDQNFTFQVIIYGSAVGGT